MLNAIHKSMVKMWTFAHALLSALWQGYGRIIGPKEDGNEAGVVGITILEHILGDVECPTSVVATKTCM